MNAIAPISASPASLVQLLNGLLDAEQNSVFREMSCIMPYLGGATCAVRKALATIVETSQRHTIELAELILELGGEPAAKKVVREQQFLGYLAAKYLVPKLAQTRQQIVTKYEQAIEKLSDGPAAVKALLEKHLGENRADAAALEK